MLFLALAVVLGFVGEHWRSGDLPKGTRLVVEPGTAKVF